MLNYVQAHFIGILLALAIAVVLSEYTRFASNAVYARVLAVASARFTKTGNGPRNAGLAARGGSLLTYVAVLVAMPYICKVLETIIIALDGYAKALVS